MWNGPQVFISTPDWQDKVKEWIEGCSWDAKERKKIWVKRRQTRNKLETKLIPYTNGRNPREAKELFIQLCDPNGSVEEWVRRVDQWITALDELSDDDSLLGEELSDEEEEVEEDEV